MAGYQTIQALRPILHRGPVPTPVVDRSLIDGLPKPQVDEAKPFFVTTKMIARMRKLRAEGLSYPKIARELRVSHRTVSRYTQDIDPPHGSWAKNASKPQYDYASAARLKALGWSCPKIAREFGTARSTIYYLLHGRKKRNKSVVQSYVGAVARASGLRCRDLRCPMPGGGKKGGKELCKARAILFWVVFRSTGESKVSVGRMLGGFSGTTIMDGIVRVDRVVQALGLNVPQFPAHLIKPLWRADWDSLPCAR